MLLSKEVFISSQMEHFKTRLVIQKHSCIPTAVEVVFVVENLNYSEKCSAQQKIRIVQEFNNSTFLNRNVDS
jgi:hypothetical protein